MFNLKNILEAFFMKKTVLFVSILLTNAVFAQLYTPNGASTATTDPSTGNVGIGIDTPQSRLTVYEGGGVGSNHLELRTNHLRNPDRYFMKNIIFGTATEDVTFSLRQDGQMYVDGKVGIGTDTPENKLDVRGGVISSQNNTNEGGAIFLENPTKTAPNTAIRWAIYNMTGQYGNSLQFWNYSADGTLYSSRLKLSDDGNMALFGKFEAKEIKVTSSPTADFVFDDSYNLPKLEDIEKHIKDKKHLPEIASAKEMEKEGINVGEFQIKLLQKIEELTLYSIEQNKQIKHQVEELKSQSEQLKELQEENKTLKLQSEDIKELKKQVQELLTIKK